MNIHILLESLRLRYEPKRLTRYRGLWRLYINVTITILDFTHRSLFHLETRFRTLDSLFAFR
jgi:hypothetical protein